MLKPFASLLIITEAPEEMRVSREMLRPDTGIKVLLWDALGGHAAGTGDGAWHSEEERA